MGKKKKQLAPETFPLSTFAPSTPRLLTRERVHSHLCVFYLTARPACYSHALTSKLSPVCVFYFLKSNVCFYCMVCSC